MQVELIHVRTSDGLGLDGVLRTPQSNGRGLPIDACIMVHGRGGNFYAPGLFDEFAGELLKNGLHLQRDAELP